MYLKKLPRCKSRRFYFVIIHERDKRSFLDRHIRVVLLLFSLVSEGKAAARDVTIAPFSGVLIETLPLCFIRMIQIVAAEVEERLNITHCIIELFVSPVHAYDAHVVRVCLNKITIVTSILILEG